MWECEASFPEIQKRLIADFADSVIGNRQPKTSLEQSLIVQKLIEGVYTSSATGRHVYVNKPH